MADQKEIDLLTVTGNEHEALNSFYLAATPRLFEWLRWLLTIAALTYAQTKVHSIALGIVIGLAYFLMIGYFNAYFYQFRIARFPFMRKPMHTRIASILLSAVLGFATYYLITISVKGIVTSQTASTLPPKP